MPQFKVSLAANKDLFEIGQYTQNKFGIKQRNKYLYDLSEKFQFLTDKPELGLQKDNIRKNYYSYPVQGHTIYYKKYNYGIRIIRVLHQSMDFQKHL